MTDTRTTLLQALRHPDTHERSRAALALGKQGYDADALAGLIDALADEPELMVREDLTWALARMGAESLQPLVDLLGDSRPEVRHQAAHVLGKLGDRRAVAGLVRVLEDESAQVVMKAVFALGQIKDAEAIPALVGLLGHGHMEIHDTITNVLHEFDAQAVQPLAQMVGHERWEVREQVAEVLGLIADPDALPALTELLADVEWQVRFAAVMGLGSLGSGQARTALEPMQQDTHERVRAAANKLITRLNTPRRRVLPGG